MAVEEHYTRSRQCRFTGNEDVCGHAQIRRRPEGEVFLEIVPLSVRRMTSGLWATGGGEQMIEDTGAQSSARTPDCERGIQERQFESRTVCLLLHEGVETANVRAVLRVGRCLDEGREIGRVERGVGKQAARAERPAEPAAVMLDNRVPALERSSDGADDNCGKGWGTWSIQELWLEAGRRTAG